MTSRIGPAPRLATGTRPRFSSTVLFPMAVALFAGSMAVCGAAGASAPPKPATMVYLHHSGTGNRALSSVALPAEWTVVWKFDCQNAAKQRGTFMLSSTEQGAPEVKLTDQTGLGGGGRQPFTKAGRYSFAINTSCGWDLTVEGTPPPPPPVKTPPLHTKSK